MNNYANNVAHYRAMKKITFKDFVTTTLFTVIFLCFGWLIMNADIVSELSKNGAIMAVLSVMPSTFPYLVLSGFIVKGGIAELAGKILSPLSKFYRLPPSSVCAVFISLISGFPVPSAMAYSLYRDGRCSLLDGEHICAFCSFCGPPFIISLFGTKVMGDLRAGVVLFAVQSALALIFGKILAVSKAKRSVYVSRSEINKKAIPKSSASNEAKKSTDIHVGVLICRSITDGGISMLKIVSFVIFFAIFSGFCENLILLAFPNTPDIIISLIRGFLEISSGISSLLQMEISENLKFILGGIYIYWSGMSVFFQVSSSAEGIFSMKKYLLGRAFMICIGVPIAYFIYFFAVR